MADTGFLGNLAQAFFPDKKGPRVDRRRSLALKLLRNPEVSWEPRDTGEGPVTIRIPLQRKKVPAPIMWLAKKLARQEPPKFKNLQLDPVGSYVWRNADGERTVREMIWKLCEEYMMNRRDAEFALLDFLGKLSTRNLIGFQTETGKPA